MVHVWSINSGERFQGHHGPLVTVFRVHQYRSQTLMWTLRKVLVKHCDLSASSRTGLIFMKIKRKNLKVGKCLVIFRKSLGILNYQTISHPK